MRILIADDESSARIRLVSMIQEMAHPFEICGEAENEQQLLQLLQEYKPDIVLHDYQIAVQNGLAIMEAGKELSPLTKWIILSGYADYEPAHDSVKCGASDFLLKPPSVQELEAALLRAQDCAEKQGLHFDKHNEDTWVDALVSTHEQSLEHHSDNQMAFWGIRPFIDSYLNEMDHRAVKNSLIEELVLQMNKVELAAIQTSLVEVSEGDLVLVGTWLSGPLPHEAIVNELASIAEAKLLAFHHEQAAATFVMTDVCPSLEKLQEQLAVAEHCAAMRVTKGMGRSWTLSQLDPHGSELYFMLGQIMVDLSNSYQHKNYMAFMNLVDQLQSFVIRHGLNEFPQDTMLNIMKFTAYALRLQVDPSAAQWVEQLYKHGETLLPHHGLKDSGERMVEQVIEMIEQDYSNSILALSEYAKQFRTTAHYLNARFIQVTGLSFVKYLSKLRVNKAKLLFADPSSDKLSLQQIAEQVGFTSTRQLGRSMTEFEGCSSTAYRKNLKRTLKEK
ncbi:response regulator [Paenibacillus albiflavus]|uniref:Response regulator n=1 Tax=Paenibacillus albiflavus TaxID=2545760 RepID=A0A4R4EKL3_9BACL|nr:response regulator [Paenibacillus albiflavus]TCZ78825.1 response regulator [Paenibacillus albiflavus]